MKTKMTIPYSNRFWIMLKCGLVLVFLAPVTILLIVKAKQFGSALICVALMWILLGGAWKRLNYGIRMDEKRIVLRSQHHKQIVPYDSVREVVVTFTEDQVSACVNLLDGGEIRFVWKEILTDSKKVFPGWGWGSNSIPICIGIRMTDRFVKNSIERLSQCEKVRIENAYSLNL